MGGFFSEGGWINCNVRVVISGDVVNKGNEFNLRAKMRKLRYMRAGKNFSEINAEEMFDVWMKMN